MKQKTSLIVVEGLSFGEKYKRTQALKNYWRNPNKMKTQGENKNRNKFDSYSFDVYSLHCWSERTFMHAFSVFEWAIYSYIL